MSQIDLNKYREFVLEVTSKPSKDLTEFMNRLDELDANYIGEGKHGPQINVPLLYGNAERWKSAQKDGYIKDKLGKIQLPIIMFKRNSIENNETLKFLRDQKLTYPTVRKYSHKHSYDRFSLLNPDLKKRFEAYDVRMPNYVTLTYEVVFWTGFTEHNNKIIEQFQYANELYWGEDDKYKFRVLVGNFDNQQEVGAGAERIIRTTCTLSVNAYLLPKRFENQPTTQKGFTIRKVVVGNEVVLNGGLGTDVNGKLTTNLEDKLDAKRNQILGNDLEKEDKRYDS